MKIGIAEAAMLLIYDVQPPQVACDLKIQSDRLHMPKQVIYLNPGTDRAFLQCRFDHLAPAS